MFNKNMWRESEKKKGRGKKREGEGERRKEGDRKRMKRIKRNRKIANISICVELNVTSSVNSD